MTLTTNRGKTFDINWIWATTRSGDRLMIELKDDRPMAEVAADFEQVETFEKTTKEKPGVKEVYAGYTCLIGMSRENAEGVILLTLERNGAA